MSKLIVPHERITGPHVRGRVFLWVVRDDGTLVPVTLKHNQIQYSWGFIAAKTLGFGDRGYAIRYMLIEYENVADPADPVTVPSFGRDEGLEYYDSLAMMAGRDYLRVPMLQEPMLGIEGGFEDYFVDGESGNKLTFFAQSMGTEGVHMTPFGAGSNSKVYGAALVAGPGGNDRSRDVVFARTYFDVADQTVKEASSQIGITWETSFE